MIEAEAGYTLITPSYDRDVERCRLLCESIDRHAGGTYTHQIVVDHIDYPLFRTLAGPRREIVDKEDLLPRWVRPTNLSLGRFRRRVWISLRSKPLGGWLMQQVAKMTLARQAATDIVIVVDSDVCFIRSFTVDRVLRHGKVHLHRVPAAIARDKAPHRDWCDTAGRLLAVSPVYPAPDFISQLVTWRSPHVDALCARIEQTTGRHWIAAVANKRRFSEYLTYGMFIERILGDAAGHVFEDTPLCHSYWDYAPLTAEACRRFVAGAGERQVAVGVQSVSGTPMSLIRSCLLGA